MKQPLKPTPTQGEPAIRIVGSDPEQHPLMSEDVTSTQVTAVVPPPGVSQSLPSPKSDLDAVQELAAAHADILREIKRLLAKLPQPAGR